LRPRLRPAAFFGPEILGRRLTEPVTARFSTFGEHRLESQRSSGC
jgi:hypothetical protein